MCNFSLQNLQNVKTSIPFYRMLHVGSSLEVTQSRPHIGQVTSIHTEDQDLQLPAQSSFNQAMTLSHFSISEKRKPFQNVVSFPPTVYFSHSFQTQSLISHYVPGTQPLVLVTQWWTSRQRPPSCRAYTSTSLCYTVAGRGGRGRKDDQDLEGKGGKWFLFFFPLSFMYF